MSRSTLDIVRANQVMRKQREQIKRKESIDRRREKEFAEAMQIRNLLAVDQMIALAKFKRELPAE